MLGFELRSKCGAVVSSWFHIYLMIKIMRFQLAFIPKNKAGIDNDTKLKGLRNRNHRVVLF